MGKERQRILVIDDDQDLLRLLSLTLESEGFDTVMVADEAVASRILKSLSPDLVILDAETGGLDNIEGLDHLREQSQVPVIVLSSKYEMEELKNAFTHGADDYVRKPFVNSLLVARIRAKLRRVSSSAAVSD